MNALLLLQLHHAAGLVHLASSSLSLEMALAKFVLLHKTVALELTLRVFVRALRHLIVKHARLALELRTPTGLDPALAPRILAAPLATCVELASTKHQLVILLATTANVRLVVPVVTKAFSFKGPALQPLTQLVRHVLSSQIVPAMSTLMVFVVVLTIAQLHRVRNATVLAPLAAGLQKRNALAVRLAAICRITNASMTVILARSRTLKIASALPVVTIALIAMAMLTRA